MGFALKCELVRDKQHYVRYERRCRFVVVLLVSLCGVLLMR